MLKMKVIDIHRKGLLLLEVFLYNSSWTRFNILGVNYELLCNTYLYYIGQIIKNKKLYETAWAKQKDYLFFIFFSFLVQACPFSRKYIHVML